MISFILNDKLIKTDVPKGSTVLDFVRNEKRLMGTKIGCREGDCGACTILVGTIENGELEYQSMTSCITPVSNVEGKHVLTVEGINSEKLTPSQSLMVQHNGTQCGFCTPGFIMSMTGFTLSEEEVNYKNAIKAIDGNICRCTGYKSIERAADSLCQILQGRPPKDKISWLVQEGHLSEYMIGIPDRLIELEKERQNGILNNNNSTDFYLGGGTDLLVQKPETIKKSVVKNKFDDDQLKGIEFSDNMCKIGAATTVTDLEKSPKFNNAFPDLEKYIKLVSSTPIRNMATIGGNFVNASPIGDMTIFFLALDSSIFLKNKNETRRVALKDFFLGYKKMDKKDKEYIETIEFAMPAALDKFNFEKVCKRTHLDIASVNSACKISLAEDGSIVQIHISAGGVAPIPKYLKQSSEFLIRKKITDSTLQEFFKIVNKEVAPISDARGTAEYKRLLLRQLIVAHFIKFFGPMESIIKILRP